jgi:hypothetical protein
MRGLADIRREKDYVTSELKRALTWFIGGLIFTIISLLVASWLGFSIITLGALFWGGYNSLKLGKRLYDLIKEEEFLLSHTRSSSEASEESEIHITRRRVSKSSLRSKTFKI